MIDIKEKQETDPLENYKGKWAICYVLDNGACSYSTTEGYKDTEQEKLDDIEECKKSAINSNKRGKYQILHDGKNERIACMFNAPIFKTKAKSRGYPICISMFPIPVGED